MSSLTGKSLNPVMNRRSVIASAAGLGAMSILAGCSSNGGDSGSASGDASFKIGTIGPLTGANASYGKSVTQGVELGCKDFSTKELPLASKAEDDQADGEKAVSAYNVLKDWGMQLSLGSVTSKPGEATSVENYADRIFALTPSASSQATTEGKDNVFQVCFTDPNQGISSADYIAENMPDAKIAVLYRNDDAYSQGIHDTFVKEATEKGMSVVYEGTFTNDTATDFSVQLSGAQSNGADLVFMPIYYQPASIVLAQAKAMGYAPTFFGVDGMDGILTMEGFDPSLAEGLMLLTPFSATVPETQSFVEAYTAANDGVTPNQFAADAYDGVYIVKEALEKAGCTADMSSADICEALVAQMTQISYSGLTGKDMTWNAEGQVSKAPTAYVIKGGEYVLPEA